MCVMLGVWYCFRDGQTDDFNIYQQAASAVYQAGSADQRAERTSRVCVAYICYVLLIVSYN